jgi:hypothetical protein
VTRAALKESKSESGGHERGVSVTTLRKIGRELRWWGRGLVWQLPEEPYPSDHPWRLRRH